MCKSRIDGYKRDEVAGKDVVGTITQRTKTYGDYHMGVILREEVMELFEERYRQHHGCAMSLTHRGYLVDIVNKLARLAVNPTHIDSWHDVQGYAELIERQLTKEEE